MANEFEAKVTEWGYIGDIPALGSLQLTMLARSFEQLEITPLTDLFPDINIQERIIVVEQIIEGLGIMPIVRFAVPNGGFLEPNRIRSMTAIPAVVREDDFIEQHLINQLRKPGTMNQAWGPEELVQRRVQQLVNRHARTKDLFRAKTLLGGIKYTDPRSGVAIDVSTNIPAHNYFSYDGFNSTVEAAADIAGTPYKAAKALTNDKGRPEALMFRSTDGRAGVSWTDPRADLIGCLRLLKQYLYKTNKNRFNTIVMSSDLMTVIMENEYIKSLMNVPGIVINNHQRISGTGGDTQTVSGNALATNGTAPASFITFGAGGDITSIAGLNIKLMDGLYRDPVTGEIQTFWPANKVALVASGSASDPSARLGFTYHCSGEAPDGSPGMFMRVSGMSEPPAPAGRTMQLGDAFLPVVIYPHWISLLDVCEPDELKTKFILQANLNYGTF
jgi:hypothetical protein